MKKICLFTMFFTASLSINAIAHDDADDQYQRAIKYRQSAFTLVGANFTPMQEMIKGERPWNDAQMMRYAKDLAAVTNVDIARGFIEGSEFGRTKAREEIWENMDDFKKRLVRLGKDTTELQQVIASRDKDAIKKKLGQVGKDNCKACHKKYKSKEYAE